MFNFATIKLEYAKHLARCIDGKYVQLLHLFKISDVTSTQFVIYKGIIVKALINAHALMDCV